MFPVHPHMEERWTMETDMIKMELEVIETEMIKTELEVIQMCRVDLGMMEMT